MSKQQTHCSQTSCHHIAVCHRAQILTKLLFISLKTKLRKEKNKISYKQYHVIIAFYRHDHKVYTDYIKHKLTNNTSTANMKKKN